MEQPTLLQGEQRDTPSRIISILLSPIIPGYAKKSLSFLGEDALSWQAISKPMLGCKINKFESIVTRIEDKHIEKLMGA